MRGERRGFLLDRGLRATTSVTRREQAAALRLTRAAELVEAGVEETLTYYAFPEEHWRGIRTNNSSARSDGARASWARSQIRRAIGAQPRRGQPHRAPAEPDAESSAV